MPLKEPPVPMNYDKIDTNRYPHRVRNACLFVAVAALVVIVVLLVKH